MSRYYISNSRKHAVLKFDLEKFLCRKIQRLPITMSDLGTVSNDQEASAQRDVSTSGVSFKYTYTNPIIISEWQ